MADTKFKAGEANRNQWGRGGRVAGLARPHVDKSLSVVVALVNDENAPDGVRLDAALAVLRMAKGDTP